MGKQSATGRKDGATSSAAGVNTQGVEPAQPVRGDAPPNDPMAFVLLVAHYTAPGVPPRVLSVDGPDEKSVLTDAARLVEELVTREGGRLPSLAVRELVGNVAHAGVEDAVISILDGGNTLRVSDRGPGIPDKERALLPGFTTAGPLLRGTIRGVGSGLGLVRESLAALEGTLEIDDNLAGGTVVTARVPRPPEADHLPGEGEEQPRLSERQLRALLLIVELGPVGPTPLARELGISASTAYRDLVSLEQGEFVQTEPGGLRTVTEQGLTYIHTVL